MEMLLYVRLIGDPTVQEKLILDPFPGKRKGKGQNVGWAF